MGVQKWVIKNEEGLISGPFTTPEVMAMISQSLLIGEEQISPYPGARWIQISQEPEFYDKLIEVLSQGIVPPLDRQRENEGDNDIYDDDLTPPPEEYNSYTPIDTQQSSYDDLGSHKEEREDEEANDKSTENRASDEESLFAERIESDGDLGIDDNVIELREQKQLDQRFLKWQKLKPLVGVVVIAFLFLSWLFWPNSSEESYIRLKFPQSHLQDPLTIEQVQTLIAKGEALYALDTYETYLQAQDHFVRALESNTKEHKAWALLCMTYLELWPYVKQDSEDLSVIKRATRLGLAADLGGPNGATCRSVSLLLQGQMIELKSLVSDILEQFGSSQYPPVLFYYLKGKYLELESRFEASVGYYSSAQKLWPSWIKPFYQGAVAYKKMNRFSEAATVFENILKVTPHHVPSQIELGIIEYAHFNHKDQGYKRLKASVLAQKTVSNEVLSRAYFHLAKASMDYQDLNDAKEYSKKAFIINPADPAIKNLALQLGSVRTLDRSSVDVRQLIFEGDQYFREGHWEAAQANYKVAFELDPKNAIAALKTAKSLWRLSFSEEAIDWLNKALRVDHKLLEAYVLLADYHAQRFDFVTAARVLERANREAPQSFEVYRGFALVEYRRKNPVAAINYAKKAVSLYNMDAQSHIIIAQANIMLNNQNNSYQEAYSAATKAVEIDYNNREAHAVYAQTLALLKGAELGVHYLTDMVKKFPEIMEYRMALGAVLVQDQRSSEAIEVYKDITQIQPKFKEAFLRLGQAYRNQNLPKEALSAFISAARLDPADADPSFEMGLVYLERKKYDYAKKSFDRVLEINQRYPLVHYYLGEVALKQNRLKEAVDEANKEKQKNPGLPQPYILSARSYLKGRQYALCAREYQSAIQLSEMSSDNYVNVALCYRLSGNLDAAESMIVKAEKVESGNPLVYKEQGAIFESKGERGLALRAYQNYLLLMPHAPDKKQMEMKVQSLQQ